MVSNSDLDNYFFSDNIQGPDKMLTEYIGLSEEEIKKHYSRSEVSFNSFHIGNNEFVLEIVKDEGTFSFLLDEGICKEAYFFDNEEE
ncbi:MAG: hypothetical protein LUE93_17140 [Bacteroides sp.]|nr:hypothetical protein [Bacteroides sp.]